MSVEREPGKPRARVGLGITIPIEGTYGNLRFDFAFEDVLRDEDGGSTLRMRRRVERSVEKDLKRSILRHFRKHGLDNTGKPKGETRWVD